MDNQPKPFLKWVGGKRQLLPELKKHIPKFNRYYEPFVGAGALLFELQPKIATINDINWELINLYLIIQKKPNDLINELKYGEYCDTEIRFYEIRMWDYLAILSSIKRAARTIYLNKTCFNGLYRINSKGYFNTPYGKHKNPFVPDEENIMAVSKYLNKNNLTILNGDFEAAVQDACPGDFVYFDPPYDPVSETANFTAYSKDGFNKDDQIRLRNLVIKLTERGVNVMLSNADTEFINAIYGLFKEWGLVINKVQANRAINSKGDKRGSVGEVIITNYNPELQLFDAINS